MEENQVHIPDGWEQGKLIDNAKLVMGQSPDSKFYNNERGTKFLQGCANFGVKTPIANTYSTIVKKIAPKNSILFSVRAPVGKINFADDDYCIGRGLAAIIPLHLDVDFLFQYIGYYSSNVGFVSQGSTFDAINSDVLRKLEITFPKSKAEQSQIATILSKVDEAIAQTEQLIAKYTRIKTGLMQDLLTKGIDEHGNIRSEETHEFKDSPLGRIPKEWECEFLGRYVNIMGGYAFKSHDFTEDGLQLIRMGNLYNNQLSLHRDPVFLPKEFENKHPNFVLKNGDLIMSMTGTSGKRDYGFTVEIEIDKPLLLNQRVCKFKFSESRIDKTYLINLLHSEIYLATLYENATGTKQANLNSENILNIYVPFPSKEEQIIIGERFNSIDKSIRTLNQELSKLQSLKTGLMQDLLSGKVRVKVSEL